MAINLKNLSTKQLTVIIILAVSFLIVLVALIIGREGEPGVGSEEFLIEEEGVPQEDWERIIETEETEDIQTVTNVFDGYRISLSNEWEISEEVRRGLFGFSASYQQERIEDPVEEGPAHANEGLIAAVLVQENNNNLSLVDWLTEPTQKDFFENDEFTVIQHPSYDIWKAESPLTQDVWLGGDQFTEAPIEDTLSVHYIIKSPERRAIYMIVCTIHNDIATFSPICDEILPGFEIL